ncbi:hypothetical protein [Chromobacterium sp. CV08]|uniref:hypothetical protein n=1 Tax=Chromobacterium sp. CV08 TaxID=3133274 RepID=UPI003DA89937
MLEGGVMRLPGIPANETGRIQVLRQPSIPDTDPEDRHDAITAYRRFRFTVQIALISLVDAIGTLRRIDSWPKGGRETASENAGARRDDGNRKRPSQPAVLTRRAG